MILERGIDGFDMLAVVRFGRGVLFIILILSRACVTINNE